MIVSETNPPDIEKCIGSVHSFERGPDPWHKDAFPEEFKFAGRTGNRTSGWFALDWCGNAIGFISDGTEM